MSDDKITYRNAELTTDDAVEFLNSFGPTADCQVCSSNQWGINFSPADGQYVEFTTRAPVGGRAYGFGVYFVTCDVCGFTRTHSINALAEWKKGKNRS